jgi:hypothetical protein
MDDITMCASVECSQSKECYRHPDSGTKPAGRQSWAMFDAFNCEDYIPIKWTPKPTPTPPA